MNKPLELCEEFFERGYCLGIKDGFWILYRGGKEIATFPTGIPRTTINGIINYYEESEYN
ncbi:MAG: hypothetical protein AB1567_13165 [bacterium]